MTACRDQARRQALPGGGTRAAVPRSAAAQLLEHGFAARDVPYGHLAGQHLWLSLTKYWRRSLGAGLHPSLRPS